MFKLIKKSLLLIILLTLALLFGLDGITGIAEAGDPYTYTSVVSTYPITETATIGADVDGNVRVIKVVFSNQSAAAATVAVYKLADATTTITAVAQNVSVPANANTEIDFPGYAEPVITDVGFRASTPTVISVFMLYR